MTTNSITSYGNNGGTTFAGPKAVDVLRCAMLKRFIALHAKTGIIPTRGVTITKMFTMTTEYTGKKYKRGEHDKAVRDLDLICDVKVSQVHEEMDAAKV